MFNKSLRTSGGGMTCENLDPPDPDVPFTDGPACAVIGKLLDINLSELR